MRTDDSLEKPLMLGKIEGRRRRGNQRRRWLDGIPDSVDLNSEGLGSLACCSPQGRRVRHDLVTEQHSDGQALGQALGTQ